MPSLQLTQEIYPFEEYTLLIECDYSPLRRGRFSGPPEDCYPDEPEELEITSITLLDCPFIATSTELLPYFTSDALESLHDATLFHIHDTPEVNIPDRDICIDYSPDMEAAP